METSIVKQGEGLLNEDWYSGLIDDIKSMTTEKTVEAHELIMEFKWTTGKLIFEQYKKFEGQKIYGEKIAENIARDIGKSAGEVWACMRFYKLFTFETFNEVLDKLPPEIHKGNATWYFIKQNVLGDKDERKGRPRVNYRIEEVLEAFKEWFKNTLKSDFNDLDKSLSDFKRYLVKPRK